MTLGSPRKLGNQDTSSGSKFWALDLWVLNLAPTRDSLQSAIWFREVGFRLRVVDFGWFSRAYQWQLATRACNFALIVMGAGSKIYFRLNRV